MINKEVKTIITTDGSIDLSDELLEKYNITQIIPIYTTIGGKMYKSSKELSNKEMYKLVDEYDELPKTAAPTPLEFKALFDKLTAEGWQIVHIGLGSNFSSAFNNARLMALEYENVYVADSNNLSTGIGLLVIKAAILAKEGYSAKEIYDIITELSEKVELSFVVDTLLYLKKGGRCSALEYLGTSILKLKVCLELKDGLLKPGKKYRGSIERCAKLYLKERLENRDDFDTERAFITHNMENKEFVEEMVEYVKSLNIFKELLVTDIGITVGTHSGPNTLGIVFLRK